MRIALAQINPTVGDVEGNTDLICQAIARAADAGAQLVILPELSVTGYPPKDLLLKPAVIEACEQAVHDIAAGCTATTAIVGYPARSDDETAGRPLYNAAAVCHQGRILHRHVKSLLPTYDVFDEHRYFEPGQPGDIVPLAGREVAVTVCEDLWAEPDLFPRVLYHEHPVRTLAEQGANLLVNLSASPFVKDKHDFRLRLMATAAKRYGLPLAYCNQVGGNDELIFDGNSCVIDHHGQLIAHAKDFESDLLIADLPDPEEGAAPSRAIDPPHHTGLASVYHALVLGLRDYCRKCGFSSIVVGLSGGIDSAVTCAICVAALGAEHVTGIGMPSQYSSPGSVDDSRKLAENLGIPFHVVPISDVQRGFDELLSPYFMHLEKDITEENIQARARGVILMAFSNKFRSLLVTTGNKSELAVGYCTLYGDMAGGLAVLSDVPKTMVYDLACWINNSPDSPLRQARSHPVIPPDTITKPPSAELRPDQTDQDSLPPYEVLDQIIERYVEQEQSADQIIAETGFREEMVIRIVRLIDRNEYKRKQAAPGLKVTGRAFGFGRRMPIAQRWNNRLPLQNQQA